MLHVRLCGTGPQVQLIQLDTEAAGAKKKVQTATEMKYFIGK